MLPIQTSEANQWTVKHIAWEFWQKPFLKAFDLKLTVSSYDGELI